jgi:phosphate transport system permease protein
LVLLPAALLLGARLWQLLPSERAIRWSGLPRIASIAAALALGLGAAALLGPVFERAYFGGTDPATGEFRGDIMKWLAKPAGDAPRFGQGRGGWAFLLLPVCAVSLALVASTFLATWVRSVSAGWTRLQCALFDMGRFAVVALAAFGLSWLAGWALEEGLGWDPRGGVFDTYTLRNALIVGFVMGFAIVPIIYTLAEDALSSVPAQLREGSLGAGATPWQTAWRIVVPSAMSGLFGALMVGLGRAVGETMIVLMAAGNTPILEWNPFNGFRTLSANLATELPEASRNTTHYRTLFLAALVLFCMTFVINTVAEMVRRAFRRRFAEL